MQVTKLLSDLKERGYKATLAGDRLKLRGPCRPPDELEDRIRECRDELVRILREEKVEANAEVFDLARQYFPDSRPFDPSEHPLPKAPGQDPLVHHGTDKVLFFQGDWRRAWPQDFEAHKGGAADGPSSS